MRALLIILIVFGFMKCGEKQEYVSPLSFEETVNLLVDLHISEAALARLRKSEIDSARIIYNQQILNKFELSQVAFDELYVNLKKDPEKLQDLYRVVYDSIESKGKSFEAN